MTRIIIHEDCGNSPKNILLQQFTIALAKRHARTILDSVSSDIKWNIVGSQVIEGKEDLAKHLNQLKNDRVASLMIQRVASHGKAGAVNGIQMLKNGEKLAFCNVYEFGNARGTSISDITSYVIPIR